MRRYIQMATPDINAGALRNALEQYQQYKGVPVVWSHSAKTTVERIAPRKPKRYPSMLAHQVKP